MSVSRPDSGPNSVAALLRAWAAAEQAGDTDRLDRLLATDFCAVGPLGFVLPREAWLARHRTGDLAYQTFTLDEVHTREFDHLVVVTARNTTIGAYRGDPIPEALRVTLVALPTAAGWHLARAHMSFLAGTRGAPPVPGTTR